MNAQAVRSSGGGRVEETGGVLSMRRSGDVWEIQVRAEDRRFWLRDSLGLRYLAQLLDAPEREVHALELAGASDLGDAGAVIDREARRCYQRRLEQLDDALLQAEAFGDPTRASWARQEREQLVAELAAAVGLGGRARRVASAAERARIAVTRRIRHAVRRIAAEDARLGRYLERTIKTGRFCCYRPI